MSDIKELIASKLRPVANAVRIQKGTTDLIPLDDLEAEILSIPKAKDLEDFIKAIFKGGNVTELIIPDFVTTANVSGLLNGITAEKVVVSKNLKILPASFGSGLKVTSELHLPKIESVGTACFGSSSGNVKAKKYFDGNFKDWINITTTDGKFKKNLLIGENNSSYPYTAHFMYFKNENDEYYNVVDLGKYTVPSDITSLQKYALHYWPTELDLNNVDTLSEESLSYYQQANYHHKGGSVSALGKIGDIVFSEKITSSAKAFNYSYANNIYVNSPVVAKTQMFALMSLCNNLIFGDNVTEIGTSFIQSGHVRNNLVFGNSVAKIGSQAFCNMNGNEMQINIPPSVTEIGGSAFDGYFRATYIFKSITPCTLGTNVFKTSNLKRIYVPVGCASAYKSATNWSTYADYIYVLNTVTISIPDTLLNNENYTYSIDGGEFQQFSASSLTLENIATFKIKNNGDVTIKVGTTDGGTEIGSVGTGAELLYATESDTTIYLTVA